MALGGQLADGDGVTGVVALSPGLVIAAAVAYAAARRRSVVRILLRTEARF